MAEGFNGLGLRDYVFRVRTKAPLVGKAPGSASRTILPGFKIRTP